MTCDTLIRIEPTGQRVYKKKIVYKTLDDAIVMAKKLNLQEKQIHKLIAYKCNYCNKYHIGRSKKEVDAKYRNKLKQQLEPIFKSQPKITNWIDLTKIKY